MFTTDSRTEKFLDSLGVKWRYTNDMSFDQMADGWDSQNLGRSQIKVQGAITEYGSLMDGGSAAPAPILWCNPKKDSYEQLDGTQRMLAIELRKPVTWSAYVVETDSIAMIQKIRVIANYRLQGGYQESSEWTLENAVQLLVNTGISSIEEVADMGGWAPGAVREKKLLLDFGESVRDAGGPEKMTDSVLRIIAKHAKRKDFTDAAVPLAGFCNDIKRAQLTAAEAVPHVAEFFNVGRSKGKLFNQFTKRLKAFRLDDEIASRLESGVRRRGLPMSADVKLLNALKSAHTVATGILAAEEPVEAMAEYFQIVNKLRAALTQIEKMSKKRGKRGK
jgi:hypothetical protein